MLPFVKIGLIKTVVVAVIMLTALLCFVPARAVDLYVFERSALANKLSSLLRERSSAHQSLAGESAYGKTGPEGGHARDKVFIECRGDCPPALFDLIRDQGGEAKRIQRGLVSAVIPAGCLEELVPIRAVRRIRTPFRQHPLAVSQGVSIHNADTYHTGGYLGQGVKVGVLDCAGFAGYVALLGSDLPASVTLWDRDGAGDPVGASSHGTACAEVVYDMAPEAELFFAYSADEAEYYSGLDWLMSQGVDVISYQCGWTGGFPNDGMGAPYNPVNEKAEEARQHNVLFVAAAGNNGDGNAYQALFSDAGNSRHFFGTEAGIETWLNPIWISGSGTYVTLTWNDWPDDPDLSGSDQDYDLYVYDYDDLNQPVASSTSLQNGSIGAIPFEEIQYEPPAGGWYYLAVEKKSALTDHFLSLRCELSASLWYFNRDMSITVPAEAPGVLAVGAINWDGFALEDMSSRGPTLGPGGEAIGGLLKPDLVAVDRVDTESWGGLGGTSGAAPHVTGGAAILKSVCPSCSATSLEAQLLLSAVDMGEPWPDNSYGYGRLYIEHDPDLRENVWIGAIQIFPHVLPSFLRNIH